MTHDEQDAEVRYHGDPALRGALVAYVRARIGWPALGGSQDESIEVQSVEGDRVRFTYTFDHDFCSQYDRTSSWEGELVLSEALADGASPDPAPQRGDAGT